MAAKSLKEVVERLDIKGRIGRVLCVGPLFEIAKRVDEESARLGQDFLNETRDFLAHEVARYCKQQDKMDAYEVLTEFVQHILKDISATGGKS